MASAEGGWRTALSGHGVSLSCLVKLIGQSPAATAEHRDSRWYRREARNARYKADATSDLLLRDSYLQVAEAYERLADSLELETRNRSDQNSGAG